MEFPYGSIKDIVLHSPHENSSKFFVMLVTRSPKLYEKEYQHPSFGVLDFFMDGADDHWRRCTDFTSSCTGQSFAFCLELHSDFDVLDDIRNKLRNNYLEHNSYTFELGFENCYSSKANKLAPVVDPPSGFDIPFEICSKLILWCRLCVSPGQLLIRNFMSWLTLKNMIELS